MRVDEHTTELDGSPVFLRRAPASDPAPLMLHGVPTSSDDWTALLERTGGVAIDLPGFGRTGKGGHLDLTPAGQAAFLRSLMDELGLGRVILLAHDWGAAAALHLAAVAPARIVRIILVNPLGPGSDPRRFARLLRIPLLGEVAIGSLGRRILGRAIQGASTEAAWSRDRLATVWAQFDQGTQRALLRLARSDPTVPAPPPEIPVTLVHGSDDPWSAAARWRSLLPHAEELTLPGTRHWPWLESEAAAEQIAASLA